MDIAAAAAVGAVGVAVPAVAAVVDGSEIEFEFGTVVSCEYTGRRGGVEGRFGFGFDGNNNDDDGDNNVNDGTIRRY